MWSVRSAFWVVGAALVSGLEVWVVVELVEVEMEEMSVEIRWRGGWRETIASGVVSE